MSRGEKNTYRCKCCGDPFTARTADRKRGWARFCSKACKAKEQTRRTGWAGPGSGPRSPQGWSEQALADTESGWDAHKIWR